MIHKPSILTSFVHEEAKRKELDLETVAGPGNDNKKKLNELIKDFYVITLVFNLFNA